MSIRMPTAVLIGCGLLHACTTASPPDPEADAQLLHEAAQALTDVIVYDIFSPPQASRVYAYASVAAYEALRHQDQSLRTLAGQLNGLEPAPQPGDGDEIHLPLAGVHAFMTVGRQLTFSRERMDSVRVELDGRFEKRLSRDVFERSIAYGDEVAEHILAWSEKDNYAETRSYPKYTVTAEPGRWVPTPPAYMDAIEPNWPQLRPFALDSASQFRPSDPVDFSLDEDSPFLAQVREVYEVGKELSEEQREIAAFWDCNPYVMHVQGHAMYATKTITPGGHWLNIVGVANQKVGADAPTAAEAFARTAVAIADGFLSAWEAKYHSNLVRPETVINAHIDEDWLPLLQTPPFPEYTSAHSVISTAAAEVLTDQFGEDFEFVDDTEVDYGLPVRTYPSFENAAAEAAISRLYGGIHYRMAVENGVAQGRDVGRFVIDRVRTRVGEAAVGDQDG
jgi:hypothetical protein